MLAGIVCGTHEISLRPLETSPQLVVLIDKGRHLLGYVTVCRLRRMQGNVKACLIMRT